MGRLLRKKNSVKKIKKTQSADEVSSRDRKASDTLSSAQQPVKKNYTPAAKSVVQKDKNFIDKSIQFLREVKVELKKVTWPSRKQTIGSTIVVLVIVTIISLFLGVVDAGLSGLIRAVLQ